jgi:hypothetical protein
VAKARIKSVSGSVHPETAAVFSAPWRGVQESPSPKGFFHAEEILKSVAEKVK